jgi:hypothetical protein
MRSLAAAAAAILAVCGLAATAAAQEPVEPALPDAFMSSNVSYLGSIKQDIGLATGAKVIPSTGPGVPDKLFVTSGKNITVYNINDPAKPVTMGTIHANIAWENEEVPTDGKLLAVASDFYSVGVPDCVEQMAVRGCVQIFDVRDPSNIKQVGVIPVANHTAECAWQSTGPTGCQFFYGRAGTIIDARGALDGKAPTAIGNWITALKNQGVNESSCHHIRQIRPGILLTACRPFAVISINPEDGGSPDNPKVLYTGNSPCFIHSARWPNNGTDKFVLIGGENNFTARCENNQSTFGVYDASGVLAGDTTSFGDTPISEVAPTNGVYADGHAPAGELGCSVHWFQEQPAFHNGGLVALAEYENGVRFLQVHPDGKIEEQGYLVAAGSSTSSPKWAPDGKTVYAIDYHRGIDIIRWNGDTYVPTAAGKVKHKKGKVRGTNGKVTPISLSAAQIAESNILANSLTSQGWSPGLCYLLSQHASA